MGDAGGEQENVRPPPRGRAAALPWRTPATGECGVKAAKMFDFHKKKKKKAGNLDFRGKLPVFTYWQPIPNYFKKMAWVKPNTGCREPLDLKCLSSQGKVGGEDI